MIGPVVRSVIGTVIRWPTTIWSIVDRITNLIAIVITIFLVVLATVVSALPSALFDYRRKLGYSELGGDQNGQRQTS